MSLRWILPALTTSLLTGCLSADPTSHDDPSRDSADKSYDDRNLAIAHLNDSRWDGMVSPWNSNLTWPRIREQALQRIANPNLIDMRANVKLCGPTAYMNVLVDRLPLDYAEKLTGAFFYGHWDGFPLDPKLLAAEPPDDILTYDLEVDWVTLGSFRHITPGLLGQRFCGKTGNHLATPTLYNDMVSWLESPPFGYTVYGHNFGVLDDLRSGTPTAPRHIAAIETAYQAESDPLIMMLVDYYVYLDGKPASSYNNANHWIRVLERPTFTTDQSVRIKFFEHGRISDKTLSWAQYREGTFAYVIALR